MRSAALAALLALLLATSAHARVETWGFRAGWSGARLAGDGGTVIAPDFRSDWTVTWLVTARLQPWLCFQPELGWVSKGGEDDFRAFSFPTPTEVTYTDFHVEHRLRYLEVPLLLRFELPGMGPIRAYALTGPAPSWLVGDDDSEITKTGSFTIPRGATRIRAQIFEEIPAAGEPVPARPFDLGVVGGLGFWMGEGRVRFGFEGRYTQGLLDMVPGGDFEFRNGVVAVTTAIEVRP